MKSITKAIATAALTLTIFAFPVLADCGEMGNGNKCLVDNTDGPVITVTEKKVPFDFEKEIEGFFRSFFGKIFG
ncbi:MAG: hypothetical protein OEM82_04780 [Acidobacteriota bacterium]|nr:hypothetical protein [Acidobacteriota bacterium]